MITCISANEEDATETRNVLNYASRAMKIRNRPQPHHFEITGDAALVIHLQRRLAELEHQLEVLACSIHRVSSVCSSSNTRVCQSLITVIQRDYWSCAVRLKLSKSASLRFERRKKKPRLHVCSLMLAKCSWNLKTQNSWRTMPLRANEYRNWKRSWEMHSSEWPIITNHWFACSPLSLSLPFLLSSHVYVGWSPT